VTAIERFWVGLLACTAAILPQYLTHVWHVPFGVSTSVCPLQNHPGCLHEMKLYKETLISLSILSLFRYQMFYTALYGGRQLAIKI